jgi:3-oxoadipate enol-lactonase
MPLSMNDSVTNHSAPAQLNWVQTGTHHAETIVLIHAVGHDLTYWDRQIEALHARYNVVAFDLPGHGRSSGDPADWSFDYAAAIVARLIESVSTKPVHLVGLSFGGMIAQVTTLARPELIRSLTLMGTAYEPVPGRFAWEGWLRFWSPVWSDG